jgi:WD40 repeat protein
VVAGYEVLGELGRGAMGVVYQARQIDLKRLVALKMILRGAHAGAEELARFRNEAEAAARLQHPHIVPIYQVGEQDGRPYLVLEHVEGGSLARQLDGKPQPAQASARLVEVLARAMHHAHERGIVHRDLKPANVLLGADGTPKITDFGLAKLLDGDPGARTQSGAVLGTPSYMAPEQAGASSRPTSRAGTGQVGSAADIYALGAILYELLTGRPPFLAETVLEALEQVRSQEPVPPRRLNPKVPRDLETICLKCLRKEPGARYASAADLAQDLGRFLGGGPVRARPVGRLERGWRWCRRKPALAVTGAGAALSLAAAVTALALFAVSEARHADRLGRAAAELRRKNREVEGALEEARRQERRARLEAARARFEGAYANCLSDEPGAGLLGLARGLEEAVQARAPDLELSVRLHLAGWGHCLPSLTAVLPHSGPFAFSPDGKVILTVGASKTVYLWDVGMREAVGPPRRLGVEVESAAFTPDGTAVLIGGADGVARLWDVSTGRALGPILSHPKAVRKVVFRADGQSALTLDGDNTARLWEVRTGKALGKPLGPEAGAEVVVLSPDGNSVLIGGKEKTARLWEAATGKALGPTLEHAKVVREVVFSADGRLALTLDGDDTARLWEPRTGKLVGPPLRHPAGALAAAVSPDGKVVLTGGADGVARLWEAATGRAVGQLLKQELAVEAVAFSPDGKVVLTGGADGAGRLWEAATGKALGPPLKHPRAVRYAAFSPDGTAILTAGEGEAARLWEVPTDPARGGPPRLRETGARIKSHVPGEEDTVWLRERGTGRALGPPLRHPKAVREVVYTADGRWALTIDGDDTVRLWAPRTGKLVGPPLRHGAKVEATAWGPDGKVVLTGGADGLARLWDAATGKALGPPLKHNKAVQEVAFGPEGKTFLTVDRDHTVRLWEVGKGKALGPSLRSESGGSVSFSASGLAVITEGADGTVRAWEVRTGKALTRPLRPEGGDPAWVWGIAPLQGEVRQIGLWAQVRTGLELDEHGTPQFLSPEVWRKRQEELQRVGAPAPPWNVQ